MGYTLLAVFIIVGLFAAMLVFLEIGRWIAVRQMAVDPEGIKPGLGPVVGVVFSLLGLLLAFTFSGAASRFDARKQLVVQEVNTLGRTYSLVDLIPEPIQTKLKERFRRCLDAELEAIKALPDVRAAKQAYSRSSGLKLDIQNQVITAYRDPKTQAAAAVLLSATNEWIENSATRVVAANTHPPRAIYIVLVGLALVSSLIAGYGMAEAKSRSWLHIIVFAAVITVTIYVILDLEFPRVGLIRMDATDRLLVELRKKMG
jgi:hypothetical protein